MTPYTATDLLRSMNNAYGDITPEGHTTYQRQNNRRFLDRVRALLHLA